MEEKNNALDYYFDDLNKCKPLSQSQIVDTIKEMNEALDPDKKSELAGKVAESHLKLVIKFAKEYQSSGVPLADLIQEGNIGLMKAIEKYDPDQGIKFNTHAVWWIRETMLRCIKYNNKVIRTPTYVQEALVRIQKVRALYEKEHGVEPTLEYLASQENMSEVDLEVLLNVTLDPVPLDSMVHGGEAKSLKDFLPDESVDLDNSVDVYMMARSIDYILNKYLSEQEREVITLRYGLFNETAHTLEECASKMGKSREHIRQLDTSAKQKVRDQAPWLKEFLL